MQEGTMQMHCCMVNFGIPELCRQKAVCFERHYAWEGWQECVRDARNLNQSQCSLKPK